MRVKGTTSNAQTTNDTAMTEIKTTRTKRFIYRQNPSSFLSHQTNSSFVSPKFHRYGTLIERVSISKVYSDD